MSRIRVLMSIPNLNGGGAERMALTVAESLDSERFHVRLFVHERSGDFLNSVDPRLDVVFQNDGPYHRRQLISSLAGNIRLARDCDVVVGANEGRASILSIAAARLLRKPLVLCVQNNWSEFSKIVSWRQRMSLRQYGAANIVVPCSDGVAEDFRALVPSTSKKMRTIYNSIPVDRVKAQAGIPIEPEHEAIFANPVVIAVGRLDYQKGHDTLIAAHALLRQRGFGHRLVILGQGDLRQSLLNQATQLGVRDTVHLLGFQQNPYRYIRNATAFALSSRFEGFGIVVAEALACGTPVVSVDCPSGPSEILDGGKYGVLVPPDSPLDLANGLSKVLSDSMEQQRLSSLSLERCMAFDVSTAKLKWESLLLELSNK